MTLGIRNADVASPLRVTRVDYHATAGDRVRELPPRPRVLPPLGTAEYLVEQTDEAGGSGANFVVEWSVAEDAQPPVIEAVVLGTSGAAGYSFSIRGPPRAGDQDGELAAAAGSSRYAAAEAIAAGEPTT